MQKAKPAYFENLDINQLKTYTETAVVTAYNDVAALLQAEYNFPQGGCQQRAHLSSLILDKKFKMEHAKIWLFAPATLSSLSTTMLEIKDKNKFTQGNKISWGYHVAPVVKIKKNNRISILVVDPALSDKPLPVNAWFNAVANSNTGSFTYTSSGTYFFNCFNATDGSLSTVFNGSFYDYTKECSNNTELEKGLAICGTAMHIFQQHIKSTGKNSKRIQDLKAIFGNATAIDSIVAQNGSANTQNTSAHYVIMHYAAILNEAKTFFNDKLTYWVKYVNHLLKQ